MKLTKLLKESIINSILADVPEIDYDKFKRDVQDALFDAMSPEVQSLYAIKPTALKEHYEYFYGVNCSIVAVCGDADARAALKPFRAIGDAREKVKSELTQAVRSATTTKQLLEAFPQFVKYIPEEVKKTNNLPALTHIVTELTELGWPSKVAVAA